MFFLFNLLYREQLREMIVDSVIAVQQRSADGTEGQPEKWAEVHNTV